MERTYYKTANGFGYIDGDLPEKSEATVITENEFHLGVEGIVVNRLIADGGFIEEPEDGDPLTG